MLILSRVIFVAEHFPRHPQSKAQPCYYKPHHCNSHWFPHHHYILYFYLADVSHWFSKTSATETTEKCPVFRTFLPRNRGGCTYVSFIYLPPNPKREIQSLCVYIIILRVVFEVELWMNERGRENLSLTRFGLFLDIRMQKWKAMVDVRVL